MMIRRIEKIENFRCFDDYHMASDVPDFSKANVIWGLNGSGKTTFSEFFRAFQRGQVQELNDYRIVLDHTVVNPMNYQDELKQVRVFNRLFVQDVIGQSSDHIAPIYYFGAENKQNADKLHALANELKNLDLAIEKASSESMTLEKQLKKFMSDTAKEIKNLLSGNRSSYNTYSRTTMNKTMNQTNNIETEKVSPEELQRLMIESRSSVKTTISWKPIDLPEARKIVSFTEKILSTYPNNQAIKRLVDNPELGEWVRRGVEHHEKKQEKNCQFCGGQLDAVVMDSLKSHFDHSYRKLMDQIEKGILRIDQLMHEVDRSTLPDEGLLYEELIPSFRAERVRYLTYADDYVAFLKSMKVFLEEKKINPNNRNLMPQFNSLMMSSGSVPTYDDGITQVFSQHNKKNDMFDEKIEKTKQRIENHKIAEVMPSMRQIENQIAQIGEEKVRKVKEQRDKKLERDKIREEMYNTRMPAELIENDLRSFFDGINLSITVHEEGYSITREGEPANNLSESEANILALIYFIRSLPREKDGDISSVIILDDPVVGLDRQRYGKACAYLRQRLKKFSQLFVLTHDEVFASEIDKWFDDDFGADSSQHYMMEKDRFIQGR